MVGSLKNAQVTVWADPRFIVFGIPAGGWLNNINNATFGFGAS
jgi:hypothetical protein